MRAKIRRFINDNLKNSGPDKALVDSDNIFELGFVNSLFALKLLGYIESEFSIKLANEDIRIGNFNSVDNIVVLIDKYQVAVG